MRKSSVEAPSLRWPLDLHSLTSCSWRTIGALTGSLGAALHGRRSKNHRLLSTMNSFRMFRDVSRSRKMDVTSPLLSLSVPDVK